MSDIVLVAIVVATSSVIVGVVPVILNNRQRAKDRAEDRADRALVAAQVAEAAQKAEQVAAEARQTVRESRIRTDEVARLAEQTALGVTQQLNVLGEGVERVHKLVNSDMTAARRDELIGAKKMLEALLRNVELQQVAGIEPSQEDLALIEATRARIDELEAILADRLVQQRAVEAQQIVDEKRG